MLPIDLRPEPDFDFDLPTYYTILWDPQCNGEFQFFDRTFYISPDVAFKRIEKELNIFNNFIVVSVSFTKIS